MVYYTTYKSWITNQSLDKKSENKKLAKSCKNKSRRRANSRRRHSGVTICDCRWIIIYISITQLVSPQQIQWNRLCSHCFWFNQEILLYQGLKALGSGHGQRSQSCSALYNIRLFPVTHLVSEPIKKYKFLTNTLHSSATNSFY